MIQTRWHRSMSLCSSLLNTPEILEKMQEAASRELWQVPRGRYVTLGLEEQHNGIRASPLLPSHRRRRPRPHKETQGGPGKPLPSMGLVGVLPLSPGGPGTTGKGDWLGSQLRAEARRSCLHPHWAWNFSIKRLNMGMAGGTSKRERTTTSSLAWETSCSRGPGAALPHPETLGTWIEETNPFCPLLPQQGPGESPQYQINQAD